jgi:hypothetical protein
MQAKLNIELMKESFLSVTLLVVGLFNTLTGVSAVYFLREIVLRVKSYKGVVREIPTL